MNKTINVPKNCKVEIFGDNNTVEFEAGVYNFNGIIHIGTPDTTAYNCHVKVGAGTIAIGHVIRLLDDNSIVIIGKDCLISDEVNIWASDTHSIIDEAGNVLNYGKSIVIGNHVWIGKHVTILKNTVIADKSIVGWGAVVSGKFFQPGSVIVGNPGKVVKTIHNWSRCRPNQLMRKVQSV